MGAVLGASAAGSPSSSTIVTASPLDRARIRESASWEWPLLGRNRRSGWRGFGLWFTERNRRQQTSYLASMFLMQGCLGWSWAQAVF